MNIKQLEKYCLEYDKIIKVHNGVLCGLLGGVIQ